MEFQLKKFDIHTLVSHIYPQPSILVLGIRATGKSYLIRDILYNNRDIPIGTVITPTKQDTEFYGKMVPPLFIYNEYKTSIVENVLNRQKGIIKRMENERKQETETSVCNRSSIDPRTFVVFDNCLYDSKWATDTLMQDILLNACCWYIMPIIAMSYPLGVPPTIRSNLDYVFIFSEPNVSNRKRIYDNYAGMFPTFELFCSVMDQYTENYGCLVIKNNSRSNNLLDHVFWYRAESHGDEDENFRIGSDKLWEMSERCVIM